MFFLTSMVFYSYSNRYESMVGGFDSCHQDIITILIVQIARFFMVLHSLHTWTHQLASLVNIAINIKALCSQQYNVTVRG